MSCFIVPILAFLVLGADQPLVPSAHLDSEGETWPVALTLDGKSLLGVLKSGDHCDVVAWDMRTTPTAGQDGSLGGGQTPTRAEIEAFGKWPRFRPRHLTLTKWMEDMAKEK